MSSATPPTLLLRSDATAQIGTGHVLRCLALAQAWCLRGGRAVFAAAELPPALRDRLAANRSEVERVSAPPGSPADAAETVGLARRYGADWVVLDNYAFGDDFQQTVKEAGQRVLAMDDYGHAAHYSADLILNQNLGAGVELYPRRGPDTRLLLGPRFALLRTEFAPYRGFTRQVPDIARKVLVTMGGTDPHNATLKVIEALGLMRVDGLEAVVVVGGGNPHHEQLVAAVKACPIRVSLAVNVGNMPELMAAADVAVAAGGATSWERALLGLPGVVMILADNQEAVAARLGEAGLGRNLGWHSAVSAAGLAEELESLVRDPDTRSEMTRRAQQTVDGFGAERVACELSGEQMLTLRPAAPGDLRLVWEWANDPPTRAWSFTPDPIPWDDHVRWFSGQLSNPRVVFYVAIGPGKAPLGQVRFDVTGPEAVISVGLAATHRGRGYGIAAIQAGCRALHAARSVDTILAFIREGNDPSVRAFTRAGFVRDGATIVRGLPAHRYVLKR